MSSLFGHDLTAFPSDREIAEIAAWNHRDFEELKQQLLEIHADLIEMQAGIEASVHRNGFGDFSEGDIHIGEYGREEDLGDLFFCHKDANLLSDCPLEEMAIVTGFGPSSNPTAGTLSMIFRLLELKRRTGVPIHVSIPDLGFINFRTAGVSDVFAYTARFEAFLRDLGLSGPDVFIRRHNDADLMRTALLVTSALDLEDFVENSEASHELYDRLKKQGSVFSTYVHYALCVADILLPVIRDGKRTVVVLSGIDEYYFSTLAEKVVGRLREREGIGKLIPADVRVCSLFGRLIEGLFPFVKMSKSIPESSINLGDSDEVLAQKILHGDSRNEHVICQMMILASDWDAAKKAAVKEAFRSRSDQWTSFKEEYLELFLSIKRIWERSADAAVSASNAYQSIYRR